MYGFLILKSLVLAAMESTSDGHVLDLHPVRESINDADGQGAPGQFGSTYLRFICQHVRVGATYCSCHIAADRLRAG
jgi:hypothetical protein